jgi:membrane-associated phospholipid phosphatase
MRVPPLLALPALTKLILMALLLTSALPARSQSTQGVGEQGAGHEEDASELPMTKASQASVRSEFLEPGADPENRLFLPFFKHMTDDQREFWGSAKQLRRPDALKTFLPFAGFTGLLIAGDNWITKQVPDNANDLKRSQNLSNYGAFSLAAIAGGSYALGHFTGNDHLSETGFLSGEAALNSTLIAYALKEATQRQRPYNGAGAGDFFLHGSSFPSEHAALAWSVASIVAHEYPGPLTKLLAYGMASAVTITRVTGKQHFSSDVVVGSAIGWYLGRQIYRARHDPELGGGAWGNLRDDAEERAQREARPPQSMGSPSVPLDSWVYPALEKLAALGLIETAFIGMKPWTRMECSQLTEEAGEALQREEGPGSDLLGLQFRLQREFAYEFGLLDGQRNATISVESVYTRGVSASGPVLTDGYHFGQTFSYDFGRPFQRGTNGQTGGSFYAALGPAAIYVRAEFQHAPSASPLSENVRNFISTSDLVPVPPAEPFHTINRLRLLDAYVTLNAGEGWQLSFGQEMRPTVSPISRSSPLSCLAGWDFWSCPCMFCGRRRNCPEP